MAISLHRGKFKHCLYGKRDDFNFSVISYPFLSGNIPKVPSYGVYSSQLLRFCQICSEYNQFKCEVIKLNKKLINHNNTNLNYSAKSIFMSGVNMVLTYYVIIFSTLCFDYYYLFLFQDLLL